MKRFAAIELLCAIATLGALIPVWIFRFFPTQDGPSHLYNSFVLAHYSDAASAVIRQHFVLNLRPFPNWTSYAISALLVRVMPPLVVQQIVISLCVISIPIAVLYLQKSFKPEADATALLGVLLAYSYVLLMGFFNFVLGAALFAIATGYWWRRREGRYLLGLYPLLLLTFLSHNLAFATALMTIAVLTAIERRWRVLLELSPAFLIFFIDALGRPRGQPLWRPFRWHVRQLVTVFSAGHIAIAFLTLAVVLLAVVRTRPNKLSVISLCIFVAYFVAPWSYATAGFMQAGWISERLLYLTILTLPAWIVLPWPRVTMWVLVVAVVAHLAATTNQIAAINRFIGSYMQCAPLIRPHSTLRTFFPMSGISPQVTPTLHLTAYLGLQTDVVDLDDYEADLPIFRSRIARTCPTARPITSSRGSARSCRRSADIAWFVKRLQRG